MKAASPQTYRNQKTKMAGIGCCPPSSHTLLHLNTRHVYSHGARITCCSKPNNKKAETPRLLKLAVSGITELLRIFSYRNSVDAGIYKQENELSVSSVDDVIDVLKLDYRNAYFVTGIITSEIYTEDCLFEDPTIKFRGRDLYVQNLRLLVPFFDAPSITLDNIEKGKDPETSFIFANWKLRTYLKLPWRPLISIDGSTVYELNDKYNIVRHAESWKVSALEAIGQIFTLSSRGRDV